MESQYLIRWIMNSVELVEYNCWMTLRQIEEAKVLYDAEKWGELEELLEANMDWTPESPHVISTCKEDREFRVNTSEMQ